MPNMKLTIDGIPAQVINFTKAYCHLAGLDEETFWRREIADVVDRLLQTLPDDSLDPDHIRRAWILDEAVDELKLPRSELCKRIDRELAADRERQEKKRKGVKAE